MNEIKEIKVPHIPVPKQGLNLGFTHQCSRCGAFWDGRIWSWDLPPAEDYCLKIKFIDGHPYCSLHGAMNKVSKHGMWRCLVCHIGYDESRKLVLKDSTEGFRRKRLK